jgi:Tol biopolymer transport system component
MDTTFAGSAPPRRRLAVVMAAAVLAALTASPASATPPGQSGHILFTRQVCESDTDPCWEIVVADAADEHETVVAGPFPRTVWDDHFIANWAPDGQSLVFMADFGEGPAIWQVNAQGTGMHKVYAPTVDDHTPGKAFNGLDDGPAFTPDGSRIVFTRCCPQNSGYGLWSVKTDGTGLRIITTEAVGPNVDGPSDNLPQVSPDGRLIAFHRNINDCGCYIATVNFAGGNLRGATDLALLGQIPNWSPDGRRIVFQGFLDGIANVWTVKVDGMDPTQLTFGDLENRSANPAYAPDGTRIIFAHVTDGVRDLFTMNPDGSGWQRVTDTPTAEFFPHWIAH